ncbi:hypothetical protein Ddc_05017 [Ditylenchus destructor]|nr:hypothetical protein Ddc_05017 [Ditylenchus destructor]
MDDCKTQCSSHLTIFANVTADMTEEMTKDLTDNMTQCFKHFDDELEAFEGCLKSNSQFRCLDESAVLYIDVQNYSSVSWNETLDESLADKLKGSVYMKKARKYFFHFRSFQKCVAGCMKQNVVQCYNIARCTVPFPPADDLNQIFHGCTEMNVYEHFNEACRCLADKHSVKLQGICPYVLNRHFMHML